jgi:hypothetical protein
MKFKFIPIFIDPSFQPAGRHAILPYIGEMVKGLYFAIQSFFPYLREIIWLSSSRLPLK